MSITVLTLPLCCPQLLAGGNFLQALITFPKDTINDETVELLQPYLEMDDYFLENARKVTDYQTFLTVLNLLIYYIDFSRMSMKFAAE